MVMPGDRIKMTAELIYPVAIEAGCDLQSAKVDERSEQV
jgi:translation elongation factor EF-Tu-like GTPase